MEMTFYDDSQFRSGRNDGSKSSLKRPMTLDLDSPNTASKKQPSYMFLSTPDQHMFKLTTPEVELFLRTNNGPGTLTPILNFAPNQIFNFAPKPTEAQEDFSKPLFDALNNLRSMDISSNIQNEGSVYKINPELLPYLTTTTAPTSVIMSPKGSSISGGVLTTLNPTVRPPSVDSNNSSSCHSNSMSAPMEFAIKEEFQTVPSDFSSPPLSPIGKPQPIDMADQERIKLERKRHRNRIAASKCRKRKLEKISQLEDKVKELKGENTKLEAVADNLRDQVYSLKQTVLDHVKKGCQIMLHQTL